MFILSCANVCHMSQLSSLCDFTCENITYSFSIIENWTNNIIMTNYTLHYWVLRKFYGLSNAIILIITILPKC